MGSLVHVAQGNLLGQAAILQKLRQFSQPRQGSFLTGGDEDGIWVLNMQIMHSAPELFPLPVTTVASQFCHKYLEGS